MNPVIRQLLDEYFEVVDKFILDLYKDFVNNAPEPKIEFIEEED